MNFFRKRAPNTTRNIKSFYIDPDYDYDPSPQLEDLPDLVLETILSKCQGLDWLRLTQASPSVRRVISKGGASTPSTRSGLSVSVYEPLPPPNEPALTEEGAQGLQPPPLEETTPAQGGASSSSVTPKNVVTRRPTVPPISLSEVPTEDSHRRSIHFRVPYPHLDDVSTSSFLFFLMVRAPFFSHVSIQVPSPPHLANILIALFSSGYEGALQIETTLQMTSPNVSAWTVLLHDHWPKKTPTDPSLKKLKATFDLREPATPRRLALVQEALNTLPPVSSLALTADILRTGTAPSFPHIPNPHVRSALRELTVLTTDPLIKFTSLPSLQGLDNLRSLTLELQLFDQGFLRSISMASFAPHLTHLSLHFSYAVGGIDPAPFTDLPALTSLHLGATIYHINGGVGGGAVPPPINPAPSKARLANLRLLSLSFPPCIYKNRNSSPLLDLCDCPQLQSLALSTKIVLAVGEPRATYRIDFSGFGNFPSVSDINLMVACEQAARHDLILDLGPAFKALPRLQHLLVSAPSSARFQSAARPPSGLHLPGLHRESFLDHLQTIALVLYAVQMAAAIGQGIKAGVQELKKRNERIAGHPYHFRLEGAQGRGRGGPRSNRRPLQALREAEDRRMRAANGSSTPGSGTTSSAGNAPGGLLLGGLRAVAARLGGNAVGGSRGEGEGEGEADRLRLPEQLAPFASNEPRDDCVMSNGFWYTTDRAVAGGGGPVRIRGRYQARAPLVWTAEFDLKAGTATQGRA